MADQIISSGSNFLMLFLVIRTSPLSEVGAFSLVYSLFFLILAIGRGLVSEPYTIRFAGSIAGTRRNQVIAMAAGAALALGFLSALICALTALALNGPVRVALLCLAPALPGLLLQDSWRLFAFAIGRPARALICDGILLTLQVANYSVLAFLGSITMGSLIVGWGLAAALAAIVGSLQFRMLPRPQRAMTWFRRTADLGPALAGDYAVNRGAEQLTLVVISALGSLSIQGAISGARALFAPLTTLQSGLNAFALPEMARANLVGDPRRVARLSWTIGLLMGALMLVVGLVFVMLPDAAGQRLFGGNWKAVQSIMVPMTAFSALNALSFGLWLGVRSMGRARESLLIRTLGGALMISFAAIGIVVSPNGGVWGMTVATVPTTFLFARSLVRANRERARLSPVP